MQDFESESVAEGTDHSQMVKAVLEQSDCGSKGCVYLPDPIAVSRLITAPSLQYPKDREGVNPSKAAPEIRRLP